MVALLQASTANPTLTGTRDYALIALLYNAGLRRSEIGALDWADLDPHGALTIQQGKGVRPAPSILAAMWPLRSRHGAA